VKHSRPLVLLSLAALLPLFVLSGVLGAWGLRQQQMTLRREAEARVALTSALLDQTLNEQVSVLVTLAAAPALQGELDRPKVQGYLDQVLGQHPTWRSLVLSTPDGRREMVSTRIVGVPARVLEVESVQAAIRTQRPALGHVFRREGATPAFAVRAPVLRNGEVVRLVSAIVEPAEVERLFLRQPLPAGWRGGVVDHTGRIVVRINASQDAVGGFVTPETLRMRARASSGFAEAASVEGDRMINAFQVLPRWGWSVHAAMPDSLYRAPVERSVLVAVVSGVVCLLLAAAFVWLLVREHRRSVREGAALAEARRMEALGRMTGGVAHDFNNLLMIVQGGAELIKRRLTDPERTASLAEGILTAAQRGQALTRQLLAFARRGVQEPVDFRLQDRAEAMSELVRQSLRADIAFSATIPADLWPIHADPEALEIALINLAVNARDAMPSGGALTLTAANVALRRRSGELDLDGDFVAIAVKDSGGGVPEEHLRHIFEPFYTTKPAGRGTGLGLSQVYGFARQAGGAVTVANRKGEGALFTLYLPRGAGAEAKAVPTAAAPETAVGRLLLVEDDPDVGRTVEAMLAVAGYRVVRVESAEAALAEVAEREAFDVALSDVMLGRGLSGIRLAERLRRESPELPVVLMSAYAEGLAEARADQPVLMKPFGPDELLTILARARARGAEAA
jgi:signal transduction histidine kinase